MTQRLSVTALTHRGAARAANEDAIGIGTWASHGDLETPVQRLLDTRSIQACAVADGMGGHEGGSLASRFVISRLGREVRDLTEPRKIIDFLSRLDADLVRLGAEHGFAAPPGSTLAALVFRPGGKTLIFNVGDSRIYRLRGRTVDRISTDDSPAGDGPDGRTGSQGHVLTQAIGGKFAPERLDAHILEGPDADSVYLLCTDGVTDVIGNSELGDLAGTHAGDDRGLVAAIFDLAMERGGPDNISLCIVRPTA